MVPTRHVLGWIALAFVVLAPSANAQALVTRCMQECRPQDADLNGPDPRSDGPTKILLYLHVAGDFDAAPINTQRPEQVEQTPSQTPRLGNGSNGEPYVDACFRLKGFNSPGLVQYVKDGWRAHLDPGFAYDLKLQPSGNAFYLYLRPDAAHQDVGGAAPLSNVDVRIETGRVPGEGTVLAHGAIGLAAASVPPGAPGFLEIRVPISIDVATWPAGPMLLTVNVCQRNAGPIGASTTMWRAASSPDLPTRLILNVDDPMRALAFSVTRFQGAYYVRTTVNSVFGSYDLRDDSVHLDLVGHDGVRPRSMDLVAIKRSVDHGGQFKDVNVTWKADLDPDRGPYWVNASIENLQRSYRLAQSTLWDSQHFEGQGSLPAPSLLVSLLAMALAATRLRR